ncbi:MAG: hypothetical protein QOJ41_1445, partial [Acidobacteriaceae bacterium]|nr:hypothetical protein [Acidobacteriaceae bacterium]
MKILSLLVISLFFCIPERSVHHALDLGAIDAYINPYVSTNNFSGIVLIKKNDQIIFEAAYGFADRERDVKNSGNTRFHIASMSMQYTAVAILRLIDQGMLAFDTRVDSLVAGIEGGDKITIRDLLLQRSGLPDINDLPSYNEILNQHQTPASLVAAIKGRPLIFEPGSKFLHEEHSAYNLLALIMEAKTHLPFASAIEKLVFRPAGLSSSGADDDCENGSDSAKGYQPERVYALKPAATIHWSAKSGSASIFTSARDQARFVDAIFLSDFLKPASRAAILDTAQKVGYGWFRAPNKRFNETAYYMNGRSPGFTSFVLHLPNEHLTAIVFSNIYS